MIRLLEPDLCLTCRFAETANVDREDGSTRRMIRCTRLDCDNWDTTSLQDTEASAEADPA